MSQDIVDAEYEGIVTADIILGNTLQAENILLTDNISDLNSGNGINFSVSGISKVNISTTNISFGVTTTSSIRNDGTFEPVILGTTDVLPNSLYIKDCHLTFKNEHGIDYLLENSKKRLNLTIYK